MNSLIINIRGTGGSGKSHLVRHILAAHGWPDGAAVPVMRSGRTRPIAWLLPHPSGGRTLAVIGDYGAGACGGCDTLRAADGGLDAAFTLADSFAAAGHPVLMEGLTLSGEVERTRDLAGRHPLHVLRLATPPSVCLDRLSARHRAGPAARARLAAKLAEEVERLDAACAALAPAVVEGLPCPAARARARLLLDLPGALPAGASVSAVERLPAYAG